MRRFSFIFILFFTLLSFLIFPQDYTCKKKIAYLKKDLKEKEKRIKKLEEKYTYLEKILEKELETAYMKIKYLEKKVLEKEKLIKEKENKIKELKLLLKKASFAIERLLKKIKSNF